MACLIAAVASLLRGKRYVHELHGAEAPAEAAVTQPTRQPAAAATTAGSYGQPELASRPSQAGMPVMGSGRNRR